TVFDNKCQKVYFLTFVGGEKSLYKRIDKAVCVVKWKGADVMKKYLCSLLTGLLVGSMLICPVSAGSVFPDVDDDAPYAEAVQYLNEAGIMKGSSSGNFNPNNTVTRAEMATILCNMLGETENLTVSDTFSDVPTTHWANKYVTKASELGFVSGYGSGKFGPNDPVTYEQAVTMVVQAMGLGEIALEYGGYPNGHIEVADEYGFIWGLSSQVGDNMPRSQIAVLVYRTQV
ncbi:S-layer homology domain-containing protein, partial [Pseudoflavonifractor sp. 60]|uniref:S-layer homology domain-containing protein n=1 Tax=Pseudoflavonifractor sp. 60 TaxID=2304576 RepID=UPI00157F5614